MKSGTLGCHLAFDMDYPIVFTSEDLVQTIDQIFDSYRGHKILSFTFLMNIVGTESLTIEKWLRIYIKKGLKHID